MTEHKHSIVQVEFFYVRVKVQSIEEAKREMLDRAQKGNELKRVVRFYDERGKVTPLAVQYEELTQKERRLFDGKEFGKPEVLARLERIRSLKRSLKTRVDIVTGRELRTALNRSRQVAIEIPDHYFEIAQDNRARRIHQYAANATGMWVFVFKPNFLVADKNELLGSVMR